MASGKLAAHKLLDECGIDDPTEFPLEMILAGRGTTLIEKPLSRSDGRIVSSRNHSIITINSGITYARKRRFVLAHELGHHEMHRGIALVHHDNDATLEYFKKGNQETEANEFATELLMPEQLYRNYVKRKEFSPVLLTQIAERFQTTLTSATYRYFEIGPHPICLVYSHNNKVRYWKRPDNYPHFLQNRSQLSPPVGSVATEFFDEGKIYSKVEAKQQVWKSDWFELGKYESDNDTRFYEHCIITPSFNTVLSVIWEE